MAVAALSSAALAGLALLPATPASARAATPAQSAAPAPAGAPPPATLLATPLLSPARLPRVLQDRWAASALARTLGKAMSRATLGPRSAGASCAEVAQGDEVVFQDHPHLPVLPASNMKVLTAIALLDEMGPNYRFTTSLDAAVAPAGGVVQGDLYLVGGGDPLLRLPTYAAGVPDGAPVFTDVTRLAALLRTAGGHVVTGGVIGDDARYDSERTVASWPAAYSEQGDVGPLSALDIDDGLEAVGTPLPAGALPAAVRSAGIVSGLLRAAGVTVDGAPGSGRAPAGAHVLARLVSPPLGEILGEVLRESDNTAMELLTKELGLKERGAGSTAAGLKAVRADLSADGLPLQGFVNLDGSGLSRSDRVTCALLVAALQRAGTKSVLVKDLPVAGRSGTLAADLKGTVAAGRVDAKTGTLEGVKALSGWVQPVKGQSPGNPMLASPVVFSTVLNDVPASVANPGAMTDRVALDIAQYPQAPALALFEPG